MAYHLITNRNVFVWSRWSRIVDLIVVHRLFGLVSMSWVFWESNGWDGVFCRGKGPPEVVTGTVSMCHDTHTAHARRMDHATTDRLLHLWYRRAYDAKLLSWFCSACVPQFLCWCSLRLIYRSEIYIAGIIVNSLSRTPTKADLTHVDVSNITCQSHCVRCYTTQI